MKKKIGAIEMDAIGWWVIAILVLVVVVGGLLVLKGKGIGAVEYLKNVFRFGT